MTLETFLFILFAISVFTGLATEALKKILSGKKKEYSANLIAGILAVVISLFTVSGYIILTESVINEKMAVYLIALVFLSWLSAMIGYDKVVQAIMQIKNTKIK